MNRRQLLAAALTPLALLVRGCGHWTQQERPNDVSAALVEFIQALPSRS